MCTPKFAQPPSQCVFVSDQLNYTDSFVQHPWGQFGKAPLSLDANGVTDQEAMAVAGELHNDLMKAKNAEMTRKTQYGILTPLCETRRGAAGLDGVAKDRCSRDWFMGTMLARFRNYARAPAACRVGAPRVWCHIFLPWSRRLSCSFYIVSGEGADMGPFHLNGNYGMAGTPTEGRRMLYRLMIGPRRDIWFAICAQRARHLVEPLGLRPRRDFFPASCWLWGWSVYGPPLCLDDWMCPRPGCKYHYIWIWTSKYGCPQCGARRPLPPMSAEYLWSADRCETQKHRRFRFGKDQNDGGVQLTQREMRDRDEMARICLSKDLFQVLKVSRVASRQHVVQAVARELRAAEARMRRYGCEHALLTRQCLCRVRRAEYHLTHRRYRDRYEAELKQASEEMPGKEYEVHLGWQW